MTENFGWGVVAVGFILGILCQFVRSQNQRAQKYIKFNLAEINKQQQKRGSENCQIYFQYPDSLSSELCLHQDKFLFQFTIKEDLFDSYQSYLNSLLKFTSPNLLMDWEMTPEQMEKAIKICDILGIDDFTLASAILQQAGWSIQKVLSNIGAPPQPQQPLAYAHQSPPAQNTQYNYQNFEQGEEAEDYGYDEYEYEYQKAEELENKRKMFDEQYISIPLFKTASENPYSEKKLSQDRLIKQDYSKHRHQYQTKLLDSTIQFYNSVLCSKEGGKINFKNSMIKNQNNRKFIAYLHRRYKSRINFTFGTLMLNLARSYLDKKTLLVYVHSSTYQDNKSIEMLLTQKEIANFINKNCISYGMFDSSDDYEIIQKYVPMKNLPAFILLSFDKKNLKEKFLSDYIILQKDPENFLEWLSSNLGISIKKKQKPVSKIETEAMKKQNEKLIQKIEMSDIINSQNNEYEEMQKLYMMKRKESRLRKQEIAAALQQIEKMKQKFKEEPQNNVMAVRFRLPLSGKSMMRNFQKSQKIQQMFEYIHCFGREQFEDQWADFDLTQTFPKLSLFDRKSETIGTVFEDSEMENIIVKEI